MNWEAIGAIGEIAGATGVIATLLYLSVQEKWTPNLTKVNGIFTMPDQTISYHRRSPEG